MREWVVAVALVLMAAPLQADGWSAAAGGVEVGRFDAAPGVVAVRVDPTRHRFSVLSAPLLGIRTNPPPAQWIAGHGVMGVANAGMYAKDNRTPVSYLREGNGAANRRWSRDRTAFVAGPRQGGLPQAQVLDATCQDIKRVARRYHTVVQGIRMIDCRRRNVWAKDAQAGSAVVLGTDGAGRVLLIHSSQPRTNHDLVNLLLALPLDLRRLMYLEGGGPAVLRVEAGGRTVVDATGQAGGLLGALAGNMVGLPNVIAFAR